MMVCFRASGGFRRAALPAAISVSFFAAAPLAVYADASPATELQAIQVVSASGFAQKITEAPASISVISEEQLRSRPYTSLVDAVRDLEGVDIGETRDKTGQASISMRGMGADYTLVLIDGRRQNNHGDIYPNSFGGNQFNHIPPLDAIERIEVIRGPASTLYGADAMGGVINIITKKQYQRWGGSITFGRTLQENRDYGNDVTTDFNVAGPLIDNTLGLAVRGSLYDRAASNPQFKPATDPNGVIHQRELGFGGGGRTVDNSNESLGLSLRWTPLANQRLSLDYDTSRQRYDNSDSQVGTRDSIERLPRVGYKEEQTFNREQLALTHEGDWDFGYSTVSLTRISTDNSGRTLPLSVAERQQFDALQEPGQPCESQTAECLALLESTFLPRPDRTLESRQWTLDSKLEVPINDQHFAVIGGQLIRGELEDGVFGLEQGQAGRTFDHKMFSLFAEDNWTPIDPFTLTAGVRYDNHDTFGEHLSPRLYGVYSLTPNWTIKGGVSTGYKTPKTTDLYDGVTGFGAQGTIPFVGNPDLQPETSVNSELALYWEHPNRHNANLTLFHNDFKDKITRGEANLSCAQTGGVRPCANLGDYEQLGFDSYAQNINIDKAVIQGVEVAGRYQFLPRWALRGNYTYTDSEQKSGEQKGFPLGGTAEHMLNATLDWQSSDQLALFLTMEARQDRFRGFGRGGSVSTDAGGGRYWKDYEIFHLGARWQMNDWVSLTARINNLLDEDFTSYQTVFAADGDGGFEALYFDDYNNKDLARNYWISLNARF